MNYEQYSNYVTGKFTKTNDLFFFFCGFHVFTIGLQKQPIPQNRKIRSRNENIGTKVNDCSLYFCKFLWMNDALLEKSAFAGPANADFVKRAFMQ